MTERKIIREIAAQIEHCPPHTAWVFLAVDCQSMEARTLDLLGKILQGLQGERLPN
jgi:hypothetical protein